jgi:hypothetical protein
MKLKLQLLWNSKEVISSFRPEANTKQLIIPPCQSYMDRWRLFARVGEDFDNFSAAEKKNGLDVWKVIAF